MRKILPLLLFASNIAFAGQHNAPAGIMGDHTHKKGEFMGMYSASYSSMRGTYKMPEAEVFMKPPLMMF